jgi:SAM-dependent methyltransferase
MPEPQYHLEELEIALDPTRREYIMPSLSSCRLGIVDVGCGIGQLFVAKGNDIPAGVPCYGFDIDPAVIAYAEEHWPDRAQFGVAPAEAIPLPDGAVDLYVARVTLPLADIPAALREAGRVLAPGGRLWITLHPISMILGQLGKAIRAVRVKECVMRSIVLVNGLTFHLFGTGRRLLGIRDSWQSETRMRRELAPAFDDIRVTRNGRHFLIEAIRR